MKFSQIIERIHNGNTYKSIDCDVSPEFIDAISRSYIGNNNIFANVEELRRYLVDNHVPEIDIGRFMLIASVPGFVKLVEDATNNKVDKVTLDSFVVNAYEKTGLMKFIILEYLSVVFETKGALFQLSFTDMDAQLADVDAGKTAFYFPYSSYKSILDQDIVDSSTYDSLIAMGVPAGYYLKGKAQLKVAQMEEYVQLNNSTQEGKERISLIDSPESNTSEEGLNNLYTASRLGYDAASVELGRYYYDLGVSHWEESYDYYMSCGIAALAEKDRENLISLINFSRYNKMMLIFATGLWLLTFALVCLVPDFSYYTGQKVYGIVTLIIQGLVLGGGIFWHRQSPHSSKVFVLFLEFVLMMCFVLARILF